MAHARYDLDSLRGHMIFQRLRAVAATQSLFARLKRADLGKSMLIYE